MHTIRHSLKLKTAALLLALLSISMVHAQTFTEQTSASIIGLYWGSVSWGDYDKDGNLDILINGHNNGSDYSKIFRNNGDNTFTEQTGISLTGVSLSNLTWGDYNNDGYLDIAFTGDVVNSRIYKNNGNNTFSEQTSMNLPWYSGNSNIAWGDYDNDGYPDLIIIGDRGGSYNYSQIYHNNGDNTFTLQKSISLTGLAGRAAWGDFDNDGYLDVLITGTDILLNPFTKLYHNNGQGNFTEQTTSLPSTRGNGSIAWGDYDNDGFLDILITGSTSTVPISKIFHNNGDKTFSEQTGIVLAGVSWGCGIWGDYDNDGWPDILITGTDNSKNKISKIYHNNHDNTFTEQTGIVLKGMDQSSAAWGDFDNDGKLDIVINGYDAAYTEITKLYHNNTAVSNTAPTAPSNLQVTVQSSNVTFTWDKATDAETPQNGLSYNLYVYENGQSLFKRSPQAFVQTSSNNGHRLLAQQGSIQYNTAGYTLKGFKSGNYTFSIQGVDAGLKGGAFAGEVSFIVVDVASVGYDVAAGLLTQTTLSMEYSLNSTDGVNGTWTVCTAPNTTVDFGTGGYDVWVRQKSLPTNTTKIASILAQTTTAFTIDFTSETTAQNIADSVAYSLNADMSSALTGTNVKIPVTPGQNLYFRSKATTKKVISAIQTLTVPNRSTPAYSIDFSNETTNEPVAITDEYSVNSDLTAPSVGSGAKIPVTPGQNLYFRSEATSASFKSLIQILTVGIRPEAPSSPVNNDALNTFDWTFNPTFPDITAYEYSINNGSTWTTCSNKPVTIGNLTLAAGTVQVRIKASSAAFCSAVLKSAAAFTINTGIHDLAAFGMKMYPNPVKETLTVEGLTNKTEVSIYSIEGKLIKTIVPVSADNKINVADLPQGIYLLKIKSNELNAETKFCKW